MTTETSNRKYYLVRTDKDLLEQSVVGIGWSDFDFTKYDNSEDLIKDIDNAYGIGRRGNQIKRFFRIGSGDVVIVPLPLSVAIGIAQKEMKHDKDFSSGDKANQRYVDFYKDSNGNVATIRRTEFTEAFQRRLRVRGMAVNDISEFKNEIDDAILGLIDGKVFLWNNNIQSEFEEKENILKNELYKKIKSGKTNLQTGGSGLELLVRELLEIEGYDAKILYKGKYPGKADADVLASKEDKFVSSKLLVQVKHHQGTTGSLGVQQLEKIKKHDNDLYDEHQLVLITSADVNEKLKELAETKSITIIDGEGLSDWIYENISKLSKETKNRLGICEIPTLLSIYE